MPFIESSDGIMRASLCTFIATIARIADAFMENSREDEVLAGNLCTSEVAGFRKQKKEHGA